MKKKIKFIIGVPILIVLGYVIFKLVILFHYRSYRSYLDYSSIKFEDKTVNVDKSLANTKFKNLNIYIPTEMARKLYENSNDSYSYSFVLKEDLESEDRIKTLNIYTTSNCEDLTFDTEAKIKDGKKYMEKNGFKNKYDVFKQFYKTYDKKINIFSPIKDIKFQHFRSHCDLIIRDDQNYFYLNGDLTGLYGVFKGYNEFRNEYTIDVLDEKNNTYYFISINEEKDPYDEHPGDNRYNELFTSDMLDKILSSIYFD